MHRRLAVGTLCLVLIATATVLPPLASRAVAATACTGWKSSYTPPTTIRVLRSYGAASGTVQTVDFGAYVANVMAWEWPSTWPANALRAGAIAVKQYGWYYTMHYRGGTNASGACYDVKDTTSDQIYRPETRSAYASEKAAIAATWPLSIRRTNNSLPGQFILTGYRPGSIWTCGAERDGFRLYQKGVYDCARQGKTLEEIERVYYGTTLQLTDPGAHQVGDSAYGDATAIVPAKSGVDAYVRLSSGSAFMSSLNPTHIGVADGSTLGRVSADVNGDGLDDLVLLVADDPTVQHIAVLAATGGGYGAPVTWWDAKVAATTFASWVDGAPGLQLLAGDFDADGVSDIALVVAGVAPGTATVYRLRSTKAGFEGLVPLYAGTLDPVTSRAFAADVSGDGRADIVIETDLGASGMSYSVLASGPAGQLAAPVQWYVDPDLARATTLTTVTDFDRDGRDDLALAVKTAIGFSLVGLRATGSAFTPTTLATSTLAFGRVKLAAGDFNGDGRGDVLVYASLSGGATGSRLTAYLSTGSQLTAANWLDDAKLPWKVIEPY